MILIKGAKYCVGLDKVSLMFSILMQYYSDHSISGSNVEVLAIITTMGGFFQLENRGRFKSLEFK